MKRDIPNRRPCINTRTDNFHFSVSFDPYTGHPVEFFITGRGKVGQQLDTELYELSVKASKLMQGEIEDDLPRVPEGKIFHLMAHVRASKDFGKFTPCPRCQGSGIAYCCDGEDASCDAVTLYGDQASAIEDQPVVS
jgi:hypothetical protein